MIGLDFPAAVAASGLSRAWLYRAARRKQLRVVKAGRKSLILSTDLLAYMRNLPSAQFKPDEGANDAQRRAGHTAY
ncbi:DNA-binding protein [Mesorhizobium tamadayense]|uniref:DNA-binding protein n=1 Tax=Mesorhizobium tamadayense TaxID=425306 RepID=A0A3P3FV60_9HYPH|nr:DNA-binding protein [Mesorhizobium tamadayense]